MIKIDTCLFFAHAVADVAGKGSCSCAVDVLRNRWRNCDTDRLGDNDPVLFLGCGLADADGVLPVSSSAGSLLIARLENDVNRRAALDRDRECSVWLSILASLFDLCDGSPLQFDSVTSSSRAGLPRLSSPSSVIVCEPSTWSGRPSRSS
jgi:hypothetical protein